MHPYHDAMVISILTKNYLVKRVLIDNRTSTNVVFLHALREIEIPEARITRKTIVLIGFSGEQHQTVGEVKLPIFCEDLNLHQKFQVVEAP